MYKRRIPYRPRYLHKEPRFLSKSSAREEAQWEKTVYYWWWRYLRASKAYERCCKRGGQGVGARIYKDFGDVFATDFRTWWHEDKRGERLFAEQPAPQQLRRLDDATEWDAAWAKDYVMVVAVPLFESRRRLQSKFAKLVSFHHKGQRGVPSKERSNATRKVYGKFSAHALRRTLEVYELKRQNKEMTLAEVGAALNLMPSNMPNAEDLKQTAYAKRNAMAATVGRYLAKAERLIYHAERGRFPCFDKLHGDNRGGRNVKSIDVI